MFHEAIITKNGLELDTKIRAGTTTAQFTCIKLGDGMYGGTEDLSLCSDLKSIRQIFGISSITIIDSKTVRLRIISDNAEIELGYRISEFGVYAEDPDKGEILYSIALGVMNKMDYQPSKTELPGATSTFDTYTSVSNVETAIIKIDLGAVASAEDLTDLKESLREVAFSGKAKDIEDDSEHRFSTDEEKEKWIDAYDKRHEHGNKTILDTITKIFVDNWNDANSRKHDHGNKTVLDKLTQGLLDNLSAAFSHVSDKWNPHEVTKGQVGLGNADNTSDANKPISSAQQAALDKKANASHSHASADITSVDASKITSGIIGIERLPAGALERCVIVANDTARFALTKFNIQTGDTVKVSATNLMYFVKDDTKLSIEAGYEIYTAGSASSVPWSGVTNKPISFPPSAHTHDDRYYTETEMNTKFDTKVNASGGDISGTKVPALDVITDAFPIPAAGETLKMFLGKVKKNLEDWKNLKDALVTLSQLKGMMSSQYLNDPNKLPTSALVYALKGMVDQQSSDLDKQINLQTINDINSATQYRYGYCTPATLNMPKPGLYGDLDYRGTLGYVPGTSGYATQSLYASDGYIYWRYALNEVGWSPWKRLDSSI